MYARGHIAFMAGYSRDLTEGPLARQILTFSVPLMFSTILQVLFNMADVAVIGRFAGAMQLGSVGSTTILVTLFTGFLVGLGNGVNVLVARAFGARSEEDVHHTVHTSAILALIVGLVVMTLGLIFCRPLLALLGTKDELIDGAELYLNIYLLGMPALALFNFGNGVLSAVGDTRRPLYYLLIAGIINVILNLFFVIVCRIDVAGVALASIISQYISVALILITLFKSQESYGLHLKYLRVTGSYARDVLALGLPSGLQNSIFAIANLFIQSAVNTFDAIMVAGNSAATNADALIYGVMAAFYTACSSFMSQTLGAHKKERVIRSFYITTLYSFGVGLGLGLLLFAFGRPFLTLFTTEEAVIQAVMKRLVIMSFSYGISAFMDNTIAASRGLGKTFIPTVMVILGSCVFRVIWVYTVFAHFRTVPSLYLLYAFSWTITAVAEIIYFIRCYRRTAACL